MVHTKEESTFVFRLFLRQFICYRLAMKMICKRKQSIVRRNCLRWAMSLLAYIYRVSISLFCLSI